MRNRIAKYRPQERPQETQSLRRKEESFGHEMRVTEAMGDWLERAKHSRTGLIVTTIVGGKIRCVDRLVRIAREMDKLQKP